MIGILALLLAGQATGMNRDWASRHILPDILVPSDWLMLVVQIERLLLFLVSGLLLLLCIRLGRIWQRRGALVRWAGIGAAFLLALPVSEGLAQMLSGRMGQPWKPNDEPMRRADPALGWTLIAARRAVDGEYPSRPVYVIDAHGYRVATGGEPVNWSAPTILFAGESIMLGKGLSWSDSMAGRVQRLSGIPSVNLSVNAYSTGQTYLRLKRELPRFQHPVAVVILFAPTLMIRDLDRNRPWFDSAGRWHPARPVWYLSRLGRVLFPYQSSAAIAEAIASDRRLLMADVALARAHGAEPLILIPMFQPERPQEHALRDAIFADAGIPHIVVPLDDEWRLFPDFHPDARANAAMAHALWNKLRSGTASAAAALRSHDMPATGNQVIFSR